MFTFDLRTEPWIPVRGRDGSLSEISLHEALANAAQYLRIESESPLEVAALHRFLLAVLHRALKGPTNARDNARWFREGFDAGQVEGYLERFHDRFDLFHPEYPFYQIVDEPATLGKDNIESIAKIDIGLPAMNFDDSAYQNPPEVRPAQAARMLLTMNGFALSGGRGYYPGLATTAILVLPVGQNLLETLCLNLIPYEDHKYKYDAPTWEGDTPLFLAQIKRSTVQAVRGLTHQYSWVSRAVRLFPETSNGSVVVRKMYYASAFGKDRDATIRDPMAAYRVKDKEELSPVRFQEGKGFWRDIHSIIPNDIEGADKSPETVRTALATLTELGIPRRQQRIRALVLGQAGKLNEERWFYWRQVYLEVPAFISESRTSYEVIKSALEKAESLESTLRETVERFAEFCLFQKRLERRNKLQSAEIRRFVRSLPALEFYWSNLERYFYQLLKELSTQYDVDDTEGKWNDWLVQTAHAAWDITVQGAGSSPRTLKAAVQAQGMFYVQLKKLREEYGLVSIGGDR